MLEHGGDVDQAVAGLLHDALEDCEGVDFDSLRAGFGADVARMVGACSDLLDADTAAAKSDWLARKRHNLRCLIADLRHFGPTTLDRFNGTPRQTRWYYDAVRDALGADLPPRLLIEVDALLAELARFMPGAAPEA